MNENELNELKEKIEKYDIKPNILINYLFKYMDVLQLFKKFNIKIAPAEILYKKYNNENKCSYAHFLNLINIMLSDKVIESYDFNGYKIIYLKKDANYLLFGKKVRGLQKRDITTKMILRSCLILTSLNPNKYVETNVKDLFKNNVEGNNYFFYTTASKFVPTQGVLNKWKEVAKEISEDIKKHTYPSLSVEQVRFLKKNNIDILKINFNDISKLETFFRKHNLSNPTIPLKIESEYKKIFIHIQSRNSLDPKDLEKELKVIFREVGLILNKDVYICNYEPLEEQVGKYFNYLEIV